jgi:Yip1 domain
MPRSLGRAAVERRRGVAPAGLLAQPVRQHQGEQGMDIVARAKGLILRPREEWYAIGAESADLRGLFTSYAMPMAAIPAVAGFVGGALVTGMMGAAFGIPRIGIGVLLLHSISAYLLGLAGVWVLGKIVQALAPRFGGRGDEVAAMKLAVYSPTAAWLAGIFAAIPPLGILGVLGLYSLYILHQGAPVIVGVSQDSALGFTVLVVVCALVVNLAVAMLSGCVLWL